MCRRIQHGVAGSSGDSSPSSRLQVRHVRQMQDFKYTIWSSPVLKPICIAWARVQIRTIKQILCADLTSWPLI